MGTPTSPAPLHHQGSIDYGDVENDPQFFATRRRQRAFVCCATTVFVLWFATYVLMSTFAREFMATPIVGNINIGILMGFGQFASTFAITGLYIWFTNRSITPAVEALRQRWEPHR